MNNLGEMIDSTCAQYPQNLFIIHEKARLTYLDFQTSMEALAGHMQAQGLAKGDKVALMLPNCPEFAIAYFAAQKIGAVAVTLSTLATPYELHHYLEDCDAKVIITTTELSPKVAEIRATLPLLQQVIEAAAFGEPSPLTDILQATAAPLSPVPVAQDDPAVMIYTAGLTGKPMGAVLTHRNLLAQSKLLETCYNCGSESRGMAVIPYFHAFGAVANLVAIARVGGSVVMLEHFSLKTIFETIASERITYISAVPRLYLGMVFHRDEVEYDLSSLKFCVTGGAAMPTDFFVPFQQRFNTPLLEGYGLTEAAPVCATTRLDKPQKIGSIGTVVAGTEAQIVDENGQKLPRGQNGELVVRGENIMQGYYGHEEATQKVLRDGWLHTGDLATMDEDGYIFLTGRKKRMIITNGFNVYPREVESVLLLHPDVADTRVSGEPDLMRGEIVKADIVLRPGVSPNDRDILRHCRTYLSPYKVPRKVDFVEILPEAPPE